MKKSFITICLAVMIVGGLVFVGTAHFSTAQSLAPAIVWSHTYVGVAESVIQTSDGGFLFADSAPYGTVETNFWLVKVDSLGNPQWNKTYGASGVPLSKCLIQTSDGGYALAGSHADSFWLIKTDSSGNVQWNQTYQGIGEASGAFSIIQTIDGGYALAGFTNFTINGAETVWLVKTDELGNMQWNKTLGNGLANSIIQASDGKYVLGISGFELMKTNSTGDLEWDNTYGNQDTKNGYSVVQTDDGGYAFGGWMWLRSNGGGANLAIVKTDANGSMQWTQTYGAGEGWAMTKTDDGGFAIAGTKLVKTDEAGNQQWSLSFEESSAISYQAYSAIETQDGSFAVAGIMQNNGNSSSAWLAKVGLVANTNPTGQLSSSPSQSPSSTLPTLSPTPNSSSSVLVTPSPSPSPAPSPSPSPSPTESPTQQPTLQPSPTPNPTENLTPILIIAALVVAVVVVAVLVYFAKRKGDKP